MIPRVLVLKADGINRDEDLAYAFDKAGAKSEIVHINDLRSGKKKFKDYQILGLPGGFAYGDDIASGKILAVELTSYFVKELKEFIKRKGTVVLGVCNGFQVLIRTGLLPFGKVGTMDATLTNNDSGHFECRWIKLKVENDSRCIFLNRMKGQTVWFPVAHGEGKLFSDGKTIKKIEDERLVVFRYVDQGGKPTMQYPDNPNGSVKAIGGICDPSGRILGFMPHPECFVRKEQHPNWRRMHIDVPHGLSLFQDVVDFVKKA